MSGDLDSGAPLLLNGRVIVAVGPATLALDAATGKRIWEYMLPPGFGFNVTPATDGERVYVSTKIDINGSNLGARMIALDAATGKLAWEHQPGGGMTAAVVTPGRVCFGSSTDFFSPVWSRRGTSMAPQLCCGATRPEALWKSPARRSTVTRSIF